MSFKVQNAATVGGNLCLAFPAGAIIALAAALDGEVVVWTPGGAERREPVVSFVRGPAVTSLQPGEVVRAVDVAGHALNARFALRRIALTTYGRTSALVVARRDDDAVSLTVSGSTPRPLRLTLSRDAPVAEVRAAVAGIEEWYDDQHGAPDWRAAMTERLAVEAVEELR
jgi:CO/xanthine dehydrogenase FAD-binding subunit